jgi:hypothetical protein
MPVAAAGASPAAAPGKVRPLVIPQVAGISRIGFALKRVIETRSDKVGPLIATSAGTSENPAKSAILSPCDPAWGQCRPRGRRAPPARIDPQISRARPVKSRRHHAERRRYHRLAALAELLLWRLSGFNVSLNRARQAPLRFIASPHCLTSFVLDRSRGPRWRVFIASTAATALCHLNPFHSAN